MQNPAKNEKVLPTMTTNHKCIIDKSKKKKSVKASIDYVYMHTQLAIDIPVFI